MTKCAQTQLHTLTKVQKERVEILSKCKLQRYNLCHKKKKKRGKVSVVLKKFHEGETVQISAK